MANKIVMIRTVGGEFIIGTQQEETDKQQNIFQASKLKLTDARIFSIHRTMNGGAAVAFMPMFPFTQSPVKELDNIEIDKSTILLTVDEKYIDGEILNGYRSNISGIDMSASKPGVII